MVQQQVEKELAQLPDELFDKPPAVPQAVETTTPPIEASNDAPKPSKDSPLTSPVAATSTDAPWPQSAVIVAILIVCLTAGCAIYLYRRRRIN